MKKKMLLSRWVLLTSDSPDDIAENKVKMKSLLVAGVDLAGVPHRPTGMCVLKGLRARTSLLYSDEDILSCIQKEKPDLVTIDAPLTLPPGRSSIDERTGSHFRPCDEELRQRKIPFFPITLGPMRSLTKRGIRLRNLLEADGFRVFEVYPGGAQDIWSIPRVKRSLSGLREGLRNLGISGLKKEGSDHELDAATGALVGLLFLQGKAEVYGDFIQGAILMPSSSRSG
jgi:predicted nuclease with RNAse H fold